MFLFIYLFIYLFIKKKKSYVLALGLESGKINIMKCEKNDLKLNGSTWTEFAIINEK